MWNFRVACQVIPLYLDYYSRTTLGNRWTTDASQHTPLFADLKRKVFLNLATNVLRIADAEEEDAELIARETNMVPFVTSTEAITICNCSDHASSDRRSTPSFGDR